MLTHFYPALGPVEIGRLSLGQFRGYVRNMKEMIELDHPELKRKLKRTAGKRANILEAAGIQTYGL